MKKPDGYELNKSQTLKKIKFSFTSVGNKGDIKKIIEFRRLKQNRWNLAFGDVKGKSWTDNVVSDNDDLRKVLQTVANAVHVFFELYPKHEVVIIPLDRQRKLLYNRIFQQKWAEIDPIFIIKAIILEDANPRFEAYNPLKIYDYFILKLKNNIV